MSTYSYGILFLLAAGVLSLLGILFWIGALLYRRWFVSHFFSKWQHYFKDQSRFVEIDGIRLHYIVEGQGPDLLLVHGIAANIFCWRLLIPLLKAHFRVWAIDLKGFGLSDAPLDSDYGVKAQASLLAAFLQRFDIQKVAVVGNSMGGAISAELAIEHPELVTHLILINSAHDPRIVRLDPRPLRQLATLVLPFVNRMVVGQLVRRVYGRKEIVNREIIEAYLAPYLQGKEKAYALLDAFDALIDETLLERMQTLEIPILILLGKNDLLVRQQFGEDLHKRLKSSRLAIHPEAGHHLQEEVPEWASDRIKEFMLAQRETELSSPSAFQKSHDH